MRAALRVLTVLVTLALVVSACAPVGVGHDGQEATPADRALAAALQTIPVEPRPGPEYYAAFPAAAANGWTDPARFPVGSWFTTVRSRSDVASDRALGLNTYFEMTQNSSLGELAGSGMSTVLGPPLPRRSPVAAGQLLGDEVDMKAGPGWGPAPAGREGSESPCQAASDRCGYSVLRQTHDRASAPGQFRWSNFGKGVMFYETDAEAAGFVNGFTDVLSTDVYWYTDPAICGEGQNFRGISPDRCRRAANYGMVIDREKALDALDGKSQPIMAFVETGTPMPTAGTITGPQVAGAVMNSVIHGASGIIYFDHNLGGSCPAEHALRDCPSSTQGAVTAVNGQLQQLAPALNGPTYNVSLGSGLDTTVRAADGAVYVIAMISGNSDPGPRTITLPPSLRRWRITAPFENRAVERTSADTVTEQFPQESTYHVYRLAPS